MTKSGQPHSIWLHPQEASAVVLSQHISSLTRFSGTAPFVPHVTLLGDLASPPPRTAELCELFCGGLQPVRTRVTGVMQRDTFFMALFLTLEVPDEVQDLRASLAQNLLGREPPEFLAHISLAYGVVPGQIEQDRMLLLDDTFVGREIVFDAVSVVSSAQSIKISDWHAFHRVSLSEETAPGNENKFNDYSGDG